MLLMLDQRLPDVEATVAVDHVDQVAVVDEHLVALGAGLFIRGFGYEPADLFRRRGAVNVQNAKGANELVPLHSDFDQYGNDADPRKSTR